jgi:hypothetical protein
MKRTDGRGDGTLLYPTTVSRILFDFSGEAEKVLPSFLLFSPACLPFYPPTR